MMNRLANPPNALCYVKGDERYIFIYDKSNDQDRARMYE